MGTPSDIRSILRTVEETAKSLDFDAVLKETGDKVAAQNSLQGWDSGVIIAEPDGDDWPVDAPDDAILAIRYQGCRWEFYTGTETVDELVDSLCQFFVSDDGELAAETKARL